MKVPKVLAKACQVLRGRVRYKQASLRLPGNGDISSSDTDVIREVTRVYVESWVVPIIDLIERGDLRALAKSVETYRGERMVPEPEHPGSDENADD